MDTEKKSMLQRLVNNELNSIEEEEIYQTLEKNKELFQHFEQMLEKKEQENGIATFWKEWDVESSYSQVINTEEDLSNNPYQKSSAYTSLAQAASISKKKKEQWKKLAIHPELNKDFNLTVYENEAKDKLKLDISPSDSKNRKRLEDVDIYLVTDNQPIKVDIIKALLINTSVGSCVLDLNEINIIDGQIKIQFLSAQFESSFTYHLSTVDS